MMKRSFFLRAACGLFASLAFAMPSQAGSVLVSEGFSAFNTSAATISSVTLVFSGLSGISNISFTGITNPNESPVFSTPTSESITLTFSPAVVGVGGTLSFVTSSPYTDLADLAKNIKLVSETIVAPAGTSTFNPLSFTPLAAVPEPTSMALLGIGMTSFLAFRRFFKRNSAV